MCEVDAKGNLADVFETSPIAFQPREIQPGLWAMAMNTEESLKEYLSLQLKLPLIARVGPLAKSFDFLATAAPGVKEILTVGKLCWEVRERHYDLVVVDAPATGHVVAQLAAPQAINELVKVGLVREQTAWMVDLLSDPAVTGAVIVAAPEEMPVSETIELSERIRAETTVDLAAVVVNKVLPELFGRGEEEIFNALREDGHARAAGRRRRRAGRRRARRRPARGHAAPHAHRAPRPACGPSCRPTCNLLYVPVPVHPHLRRAGRPRPSPRPSAPSWGTDGVADRSAGRPTRTSLARSSSCWRPRRS